LKRKKKDIKPFHRGLHCAVHHERHKKKKEKKKLKPSTFSLWTAYNIKI
jgi:hypothetical protein